MLHQFVSTSTAIMLTASLELYAARRTIGPKSYIVNKTIIGYRPIRTVQKHVKPVSSAGAIG